jgi:RimJ/RimL family protein N-acetyltransferase
VHLCPFHRRKSWVNHLRSIAGRSKSPEDSERMLKYNLPPTEDDIKAYRVLYAVHRFLDSDEMTGATQAAEKATEIIGMVTLKSLGPGNLALPDQLTLPGSAATTTLTLELGYSFLPPAWGKGYAPEALKAVLEACSKERAAWSPFSKLYVRAIVNERNPASRRVMEKVGAPMKGIFSWKGDPVFIGGEWRTEDELYIYGIHLIE